MSKGDDFINKPDLLCRCIGILMKNPSERNFTHTLQFHSSSMICTVRNLAEAPFTKYWGQHSPSGCAQIKRGLRYMSALCLKAKGGQRTKKTSE